MQRNGTIFYKTVQLLAYAADNAIDGQSSKMGVAVNKGKAKSYDLLRMESQISTNSYFDVRVRLSDNVSESTGSYMSSAMTWKMLSVISSGFAGSAISF